MELSDRVVVVTGAGRGIGAALAERFAGEGARGVVVSDIDGLAADDVAARIVAAGGRAIGRRADVRSRDDIADLVVAARRQFGGLDVFCSNAGVAYGNNIHAADALWQDAWEVNVRQHVYAAQVALPVMLRQHSGHLLLTASAAGLIGLPGDISYAVTKNAVVGLAESLAVAYRPHGIGVSVLCPLGVRTEMLQAGLDSGHPAALHVAASDVLLEPADVADAAVHGLRRNRFLVLPHASVGATYAERAADPDGYIDRMVIDVASAAVAQV